MRWPAVVALCAVIAGIVATMALGQLQGEQVVKLWGFVLATIVALWRVAHGRHKGKPPGAGDSLWPLAVLGGGEAAGVAEKVLSSALSQG